MTAPVLLTGREREQSALHACLAACLEVRGRLALVCGEAGIGKTTLVADLTHAAAARGALVAAGHCYDLTETPPYGPWTEILDRLTAGSGETRSTAFSATLAGGGRSVANHSAPFAHVRERLVEIQQPLVLVLEDVHWADAGSLDLLRWIARVTLDRPVLIVATYRP